MSKIFFAILSIYLIFSDVAHAEPARVDRYFQARDGARLHYIEAGTGDQTLIFIPGWLMPAAVFREQLRELGSRYRVIAFDPRSQGQSQVFQERHPPELRNDDLEDLIREIRSESHVLVGWSLGVLEVLDYTQKKPINGLRGVVLIDNSIGEGHAAIKVTAGKPSNRITSILDPAKRENYLRNFVSSIFKPGVDDEIVTSALNSALQVPPSVAAELIQKPYPREYWRKATHELDLPILFIARPWLEAQGQALQKTRPDKAQVEIFRGASHALFIDEHERFNELVSRFSELAFSR